MKIASRLVILATLAVSRALAVSGLSYRDEFEGKYPSYYSDSQGSFVATKGTSKNK